MYKVLMFGPQGAGKGTQAERLAKTLEIPTMSMGALLREEIEKGTDRGKAIKAILDQGNLVSDQDALEVLKARLEEPDTKDGYIIDGYPRNKAQYDVYIQFDQPTHVVLIELSDEDAIQRLSGRRVCVGCGRTYHIEYNAPEAEGVCDACGGQLEQRHDDTPEAIKRRLEVYHADTEPILALFEQSEVLHRVNGNQTIGEVEEEIKQAIGAV